VTVLSKDRALELFELRDGRLWSRLTGKLAGYRAGNPNRPAGQRFQVWVDGRAHYEHRVVWVMTHGEFPTGQLDHIDGNVANNDPANLRLTTQAANSQNVRRRGVSQAVNGRWRARIMVDGKAVSIGTFLTEQEATAAYAAAKLRLHPAWATGQALQAA